MASPSRPSAAQRRTLATRFLIAVGAAFATLCTSVVAVNLVVDSKISDIRRVPGLTLPTTPGKAGNYLVLGSDSRDFVENDAQAEAFGTTEDAGGTRSDTLMIVHIDPESKKSLLVSFPRDTLVDIPGRGKSKINAAFNDGPQKVIDTIKQNFDIDVNHYVELNFEAFIGVVNAIGTVPVYFPAPARDAFSGLSIALAPACVPLNGDSALAYVRSRHLEYYDSTTKRWSYVDAIPDIGRIGRQQAFIRRLAQVAAAKAKRNPFAANRMANAVIPKLSVDASLGKGDIFALVNTFRSVDPTNTSSIEMVTLPTKGGPTYQGQSVLYPDQPAADALLARLRTFGPDPTQNQPGDDEPIDVVPSQVRVRVLNGSGTSGLAGTTLSDLQRYSFAPAGIGNAAEVSATEIRYQPGKRDRARLVLRYVGGVGRLIEDRALVDADVAVIVGPDFAGVRGPNETGSTGARPTSTTRSSGSSRPGSGTATPTC